MQDGKKRGIPACHAIGFLVTHDQLLENLGRIGPSLFRGRIFGGRDILSNGQQPVVVVATGLDGGSRMHHTTRSFDVLGLAVELVAEAFDVVWSVDYDDGLLREYSLDCGVLKGTGILLQRRCGVYGA